MTLVSRARHWLPLLPLLGLLAGTYWLNQQAQPDEISTETNMRQTPDAIVDNLSAVQLNRQGHPHFILAANKMEHFPHNDHTTLDSPRVTILPVDMPSIHSTAKRGAISGKGDEVFLYDDVLVLRSAYANRAELRMNTDYLHIVPERELLDSDRAVSIVEGNRTLQATGLEIDNHARTIKLLSKVRSTYVPAKD